MWKHIKALRVLWPRQMSWQKVVLGCVMLGLVVGAFLCGRVFPPQAEAQSPQDKLKFGGPLLNVGAGETNRGPVAQIYRNIPITREDLGEYLIARFGAERVDFLVNRKIVEMICQQKGITVSDAEIELQLVDDLKAMGVISVNQFVNVVLKKFGKTLYEYREDVLRPKIAMAKLCKDRVTVDDKDIRDAFDVKYGPRVQCRVIMFNKENRHKQDQVWAELKDDKDDSKFKKYAKEINPSELAAHGGAVPPIHKHFPDERIEKEAFGLREGEISSILAVPGDMTMILKCDAHIAPDTTHRIEDEWTTLQHEVYDRKLAEEIPKVFQSLREDAKPTIFLQREQVNTLAEKRVNAALVEAAKARGAIKAPEVPAGIEVNP